MRRELLSKAQNVCRNANESNEELKKSQTICRKRQVALNEQDTHFVYLQ